MEAVTLRGASILGMSQTAPVSSRENMYPERFLLTHFQELGLNQTGAQLGVLEKKSRGRLGKNFPNVLHLESYT